MYKVFSHWQPQSCYSAAAPDRSICLLQYPRPCLKKKYKSGIYGGTHGLDVQGGYALGNHIGFMGTGLFSIAGQKANSQAYGEAGLGLFTGECVEQNEFVCRSWLRLSERAVVMDAQQTGSQ